MTFAHRLDGTAPAPEAQPAAPKPPPPRLDSIRRPPASPAWVRTDRSNERAQTWVHITLSIVVGGLLFYLATVPEPRPTRAIIEKEHAIAELRWTLVELRAVIADYRADHGAFPGRAPDGASDPGWFARQLTLATNRAGETSAEAIPSHPLGPYEPGGVPKNPINGQSSVRFLSAREPWPPGADDRSGWVYRPSTGEIRANSSGNAFGTGQRYWDL